MNAVSNFDPVRCAKWLLKYNGDFEFYVSLKKQFEKGAILSARQWEAVARAVERENPKRVFTFKVGEQITIKATTAEKIRKDFALELMFRNIEITEVLNETAGLVQIKFKLVSKVSECCHICGRALDEEISRACGIGPVCAGRLGFKRPTIADAATILEQIEKYADKTGIIGSVWIPKWAIKKKI